MDLKDNNKLLAAYEVAVQLKSQIDNLAKDKNIPREELDNSIIPTHIIYDLALAYIVMYNVSYNASLVRGGYHKEHLLIN